LFPRRRDRKYRDELTKEGAMALRASVTVLVENTTRGRDLLGEHGLAYWIDWGGRHFLFDTGPGGALLQNARQLGLEPSTVEEVVFSHGHYDHTGGLGALIEAGAKPRVWAHPAALEPKFVRRADGAVHDIGIPAAVRAQLDRLEVKPTPRVTEIAEGLFVTGEIARHTDFEEGTAAFLKDEQGSIDPLVDDQALFFDTGQGLVLLLGCAHSGVINTVRHVEAYISGRRVDTILGGMHLGGASPDRLEKTVKGLKELGLRRLGAAHCTGIRATARLWHELPESCVETVVGSRWSFEVRP
jgi:7,8-dihydropterin-6-yl-methyl-4-(beta-D-ribofuranosyl)aminobenzene 5'-phosphate synthase